jgi:hypothetical protein
MSVNPWKSRQLDALERAELVAKQASLSLHHTASIETLRVPGEERRLVVIVITGAGWLDESAEVAFSDVPGEPRTSRFEGGVRELVVTVRWAGERYERKQKRSLSTLAALSQWLLVHCEMRPI